MDHMVAAEGELKRHSRSGYSHAERAWRNVPAPRSSVGGRRFSNDMSQSNVEEGADESDGEKTPQVHGQIICQ